jgi:hypothetical protein
LEPRLKTNIGTEATDNTVAKAADQYRNRGYRPKREPRLQRIPESRLHANTGTEDANNTGTEVTDQYRE